MINRKKICVVTSARADYGSLYWVMREIKNDKKLELQIIVTGMHLSHEFGLTYKQIEKDGFKINKKVEIMSRPKPTIWRIYKTNSELLRCGDNILPVNCLW